MNILLEQGVFGIVTGILTTAVLFIIRTVWVSKIVPFWVATRYQGVLIEGQWNGSQKIDASEKSEAHEIEAILNINQKAHSIDGSFLMQYKSDSRNNTLEFRVDGYMWEGYVTLNFTPKDRRVTSYATALFKLHDGGFMLMGYILFRNVMDEVVNHNPLTLTRNNILKGDKRKQLE